MVVFTFLSIINVMALKDDIMAFPYLLYFLIYLYLLKWGWQGSQGIGGVDKCLVEGSLFR